MSASLALRQDEYVTYDALGLAELLRAREVSALELLEVALARAQAVQPQINAIVQPLHDLARQQARLFDAHAQRRDPESRVFGGVPFLLKDLYQEFAGTPSSGGNRAMLRLPVQAHADVVKRWLDAGLVVFGKTNAPEFGLRNVTEPRLWGPTRNPWDLTRTPGGSSGGSAAAVAAGIVPVAGANDAGGSIRIPAAACGLFGFKAGRGRIPAGPAVGEGLNGAGVQGVIARSVRDSAAMLDVLQGPEAHGPFYMAPPDTPYTELLDQPPGRLRIGFSTQSPLGTPVDSQAVAAVQDAVKLLLSLGHDVEEAAPRFDGEALSRDFVAIWCSHLEALCAMLRKHAGATAADFEFETRMLAAVGRGISASVYVAHQDRLNEHVRVLTDFHARHDLWLCPTLAAPALEIGATKTGSLSRLGGELAVRLGLSRWIGKSAPFHANMARNLSWTPYALLANFTGRPAMTVPLYWTPDGLPLGVHFTAGLNGEGLLLRLAAQLEQARPWFNKLPRL